MNKFYSLLFLLLITSNCLNSKVITIKTINDLMRNIEGSINQALVIFDVDHTLIKPTGLVSNNAWLTYEKEKRMAQGMNYQEIMADLAKVLMPIQHKISMIPCEESTIAILNIIQEKAQYVIAMTSRRREQASFTVRQLNSLNINFSKTSFKTWPTSTTTYEQLDGVFFCSGKDKGPILIELLVALNEVPNNIIIIENSAKKLDNMIQVLRIHCPRIEIIGILYENEDDLPFDPILAEKELAMMQN